jgi:hypothetical protein
MAFNVIGDNREMTCGTVPTVAGVIANSGPASGGQNVTVLGTNLGSPTAVRFGATAATIVSSTANTITGTGFVVGSTTVKFGTKPGLTVSCRSTTSCKARSPKEKATGAVEVTVTTPGESSAASATIKFSFVKPAKVPSCAGDSRNR